MSRPFKIWSADRKNRKSLTAKNLKELTDKGKLKLGFSDEEVTVVLHADGTQVVSDEYLSFIDDHTVLVLLRNGEKWTPEGQHFAMQDEPDADVGLQAAAPRLSSLTNIMSLLQRNISKLVTLNTDEFQLLVDADISTLCNGLNISPEDAERLQSTCQRFLDEKREVQEGIELIKLLKQTADNDNSNNGSTKRKRTD